VDEVHMLSTSAFNALLKIIEEPPEHLLFILATTELHKVPATILSRCQRFSFRRIGQEDIAAQLQYVAYQESIDLDAGAARVLARLADGALRDALSLLDQCASAVTGELTAQGVYNCLGIAGERRCAELLDRIAEQDSARAMALFNRLYTEGKDLSAMLDELASLVRDLLILKTAPDAGITMLSGVAEDEEARALAAKISGGELIRMMELLQKTLNLFTRSASRRSDAELCILEMSRPELSTDISTVNARLTRVEEQLKTGSFQILPRTQAASVPAGEAAPEQVKAGVPEKQPVEPATPQPVEELPMGFWQDLAAAVRKELKPPVSGFFIAAPNSPMEITVSGNTLTLLCRDTFTAEIVGKKEVLEVVGRKASVLLKRNVAVKTTDLSKQDRDGSGMSKLMDFGRANPGLVRIKDH
jgi:DNA polymerase-3 subunit gamma/tau